MPPPRRRTVAKVQVPEQFKAEAGPDPAYWRRIFSSCVDRSYVYHSFRVWLDPTVSLDLTFENTTACTARLHLWLTDADLGDIPTRAVPQYVGMHTVHEANQLVILEVMEQMQWHDWSVRDRNHHEAIPWVLSPLAVYLRDFAIHRKHSAVLQRVHAEVQTRFTRRAPRQTCE